MVTTIGFINYLIRMDALDVTNLQHLVFDEADELFNVNFQKDIARFMSIYEFTKPNSAQIPVRTKKFENCQIMMFSADFAPCMEKNSKLYYRDYNKTVKIRAETQRFEFKIIVF